MDDLIYKQDAINLLKKWADGYSYIEHETELAIKAFEQLPPARPDLTLYGYPIEHLEMIARVMAKENCTPEDVARLLQNAGEVAKAVRDEMMEMLKESVERSCKGVADDYRGRI